MLYLIAAPATPPSQLEETFENLILDELDLSAYGPAILDPDVELDHLFD